MFEVQMRAQNGVLQSFSSLSEAIAAAQKDETIWKISFPLPTGERCRLEKEHNAWLYVHIDDGEIV